MIRFYPLTLITVLYVTATGGLQAQVDLSEAYFGLDSCYSHFSDSSNMDYSELTAVISHSDGCASVSVAGGYLYRTNPQSNPHSCTPGVNGTVAMCVGSQEQCAFEANSEKAIRIDIVITPGDGQSSTLQSLSFYEQAPELFTWIGGASGPNNYPTLFAVRILVNGQEVFLSEGNGTGQEWNLNAFSFSDIPAFSVSQPTTFNIELLAYCPFGNGAPVSVWDIDEITVTAGCCPIVEGGELNGGPFTFCVGDGEADHVSGIELNGNTGTNSGWVVTDTNGVILGLPPHPDSVNFDEAGPGVCLIWHLSYENGLTGIELGANAADLEGCYSLSNAITVVRHQPEGGTLVGGPFEFCVGDGEPDHVTGIELAGNSGTNSGWVVTDTAGVILGLPPHPDSVNFDEAGPGVCLIWHLSYEDGLTGVELGANTADLVGCYSLSNAVTVVRHQPEGGTLVGGPFEFCVGDGEPDHTSGIELAGNSGTNSAWVVTDTAGVILGLPPHPDSVNFDEAGPGVCLIWHLSYEDGVTGIELGVNTAGLAGCFSLSNAVTVVRNQPEGGTLSGGPYTFCVGDGNPDLVDSVSLTGNIGDSSQFVITDTNGLILGLPPFPEFVNFDEAGPGVCLIWHLSYFDTVGGLAIGSNAGALTGCFDLSNALMVVRNEPEGGTLTGGPFAFCVVDGMPDTLSGVSLTGAGGGSSQFVITDTLGTILSLPSALDAIDFEGAGPGVCLIWHLSYADGIEGLEIGGNANDLLGCFSLSNPISVERMAPDGGTLAGGPYTFCVVDTVPDYVSGLELAGATGAFFQYVITDTNGLVLALPEHPDSVNFSEAGPGVCLIWHLSASDTLPGLTVGIAIDTLDGCFDLSNAVTVTRIQPGGGQLTGGPFTFCVGDGVPDHVDSVMLAGGSGSNMQFVITNSSGIIVALPGSLDSVDFDGAGPGTCFIWNLSYEDGLTGLEEGSSVGDLAGCFGFSNPVIVNRNQPEGGLLEGGPYEFCIDGEADYVDSIMLSGNMGMNSQYVVTDTNGVILGLPPAPDSVNFDEAGPGVCLIWHLSYADGLEGLALGNNAADLVGCFSLSNPVTVVRLEEPCDDGLQEVTGVFDFQAWPNPVTDELKMEFAQHTDELLTVHVYSAGGRLCLNVNCEAAFESSIDVSVLEPGLYYIRVSGPSISKTHAVIVMR